MSTSSPAQDQAMRLKVVLIDDDKRSAQNHSLQLKFAGESPLPTTSEGWQDLFSLLAERNELARVLAVAVGTCKDNDLPGLLLKLHAHSPTLPIVLLSQTDQHVPADLPESLKARLFTVSATPANRDELANALRNARQLLGHEVPELLHPLQSPTGSPLFRSLSGTSAKIVLLREQMMRAAKHAGTVLITGETGTGKEVLARNLHYHGGRAGKPFRVVTCAAASVETFAASLFGVQAGPARPSVPGLLELAAGGTVLFDEIGELPLPLQAKLLRFLEDRSFQRIGGAEVLYADVRVVVGTRADLLKQVAAGRFRDDLYYRISAVPLELPALRERREDIPVLIGELISLFENKGYGSIRFNTAATRSLQQHTWPGNVRELANLVERLVMLRPDEVIGVHDLPLMYQHDGDDLSEQSAGAESEAIPLQPEPVQQESDDGNYTGGAEPAPRTNAGIAVMPLLNGEDLLHYLKKFEKQMLQVALDDCAGIPELAADRMRMRVDDFQESMRTHGLLPA